MAAVKVQTSKRYVHMQALSQFRYKKMKESELTQRNTVVLFFKGKKLIISSTRESKMNRKTVIGKLSRSYI